MPDYTTAMLRLEDAYAKAYPFLLHRSAADVSADLGRDVTIPADQAEAILRQIGARVAGVVETQKARISELVNTYQDDAAGLRAALQNALDTTEARAEMIGRSEVTFAFNSGVALACQNAGVKVYITDGDEDEPCAAVNGTVQTAEWLLANPSGHPNCSRRGAAVP